MDEQTPHLTQHEIEQLRVGFPALCISRMKALDDKIETRDKVLDARLAAMNEWRESLRDLNSTFLPRSEHNIWREFVDREIGNFNTFKAVINSKADQRSVNVSTGLAIIAIAIGLADLIKSFFK
jgi:hypothetical protein